MTLQPPLLQLVTQSWGLQLVVQQTPLLPPEPVSVAPRLDRLARHAADIATATNERTRVERLVSPLLLHLAVESDLSLSCGAWLDVDRAAGLSGTMDHRLSRATPMRSPLLPPITAVMETKARQDESVSHCLVQLVAAQRWNASASVVYGAVTTELVWRFLKLEDTTVTLDQTDYPLFPLAPLLALLAPMVSQSTR